MAGFRLLSLWFREPPLRGSGRVFIGSRHDVATKPEANIAIGKSVMFMEDCTIHLYGEVTIGDRCYFNRGCYIVSHEELRIGSDCIFGQRVSIHDQDHRLEPVDVPPGERGYDSSPVHIEDNVWVGAEAVILRGVRIGYGAVVAAGAVVTRDVPAKTLVGGVPARVIKQLKDSATESDALDGTTASTSAVASVRSASPTDA
jgi:acetyltransferase-like isoleucine patch superfamily enzyme